MSLILFYFHTDMVVAIITILFVFYWFVGSDLLVHVHDEYWREESRSIKRIAMSPTQNFLKHRNMVEPILKKHFEFYRLLPELSKLKFLLRCNSILKQKKFIGKEDLEITHTMKILLSASIVQLTFGLRNFSIPHFHTFIIYPGVYTSPYTGALHRGETSIKGLVVLSWQHFMEGYADAKDKLNLGLHELAHALDLSRIVKKSDPDFYEYFLKWQASSTEVFNEVNSMEDHFLRRYAGTDEREFFSVCVEHFFEDPHGFKSELPDLYRHLTMLLRQDPSMIGKHEHTKLSWDSNYPNLKDVVSNEKVKYKSDFKFWHSTNGVLLPIGLYAFFSTAEPKADLTVMAVFLGFFAFIGFINFFYRARIILVSEDYIFVYSPIISNWMHSYAIKNIISIKYIQNGEKGVLKITYLMNGNVETNSFRIGMERDEYVKLKTSMHRKQVMMSI
ncbi:MAG: zinc-dependent peptidase [Bacteroidetes bacterium]|nr:zinc-dependent peptidase [Bacteroidota bacterium]